MSGQQRHTIQRRPYLRTPPRGAQQIQESWIEKGLEPSPDRVSPRHAVEPLQPRVPPDHAVAQVDHHEAIAQ